MALAVANLVENRDGKIQAPLIFVQFDLTLAAYATGGIALATVLGGASTAKQGRIVLFLSVENITGYVFCYAGTPTAPKLKVIDSSTGNEVADTTDLSGIGTLKATAVLQ